VDTGERVIAYLRVSTDEQGATGVGLEAQRRAIEAECQRRPWTLVRVEQDVLSGRTLQRPGLQAAIAAIERGEASALVVAKLDRLSRSLLDFAALMERSLRNRWALVALDLGVDTTTPSGEAMAGVLAVFAQFERRMIGQRTREAMAVKRANGIHVGRPSSIPSSVEARIRAMRHDERLTLQAICDRLNDDGTPTPRGGRVWRPSSIAAALKRPHP